MAFYLAVSIDAQGSARSTRTRRLALGLTAALGAAGLLRGLRPPAAGDALRVPGTERQESPWQHLQRRLLGGPPNAALGLVQGHHIFGHSAGAATIEGGLVRVRIPAGLISAGESGWTPEKFPDGRWMDRLRALHVPFKAVIEMPVLETLRYFQFTDEQYAAHAARLVRRARPDVVIIGNEVNVVDRSPGLDMAAVVDRYLDRYEVMLAAIRATAPQTRIQLYGEAYYGEPTDPDALLRHILAAMRRRAIPPPDIAGIHIYDGAERIAPRVAGYRQLFRDAGLQPLLSVEELGPRQGVVDARQASRLGDAAAEDERYPNRLTELRAAGWLTEAEQAEQVAQHLATAAAVADQAQIFCAIDFTAELQTRRGLVSLEGGRARPALHTFQFMQRLLNDLDDIHLARAEEHGGVATVSATRRDGTRLVVKWSERVGEETRAGPRPLAVPANTLVCDGRGQVVLAPAPVPRTLTLPGAATQECGGAVRVLI